MATNSPVRTTGGSPAPSASTSGRGPSWGGFMQYLHEVREELKKAKWPTRAELIRLTQVVLILITIVAVYCGGLDALLGLITNRLFNR